jgi:hypothetical protein
MPRIYEAAVFCFEVLLISEVFCISKRARNWMQWLSQAFSCHGLLLQILHSVMVNLYPCFSAMVAIAL